MRAKNLTLSSLERENYANQLFDTIERSEIFASARTIALYASLVDELPTEGVVERWGRSKRILLPRVGEDCQMEFFEYSETSLSRGAYGIWEPQAQFPVNVEQIDIMVVPGVAFTLEGARLGRGKGYYDRYLARAKNRAYTFGACYPHQIVDSLPIEPHDIIIDRVYNLDYLIL